MKPLKVVIIGSSGHWNYLKDAVENYGIKNKIVVCAVAPGVDGENMDNVFSWAKSNYPDCEYFDRYRIMLSRIRPELAVLNTWFYRQAEKGTELLNRGINVFMEKPVATTMEQLENLKNAYSNTKKTKGAKLCAMFGLRYEPTFIKAKELMEANSIGNPVLITAQKSYKLGIRTNLYHKRVTYGGTIPWVGIHAVDWISWLTDLNFNKTTAQQTRKANGGYGDLETSALLQYQMENETLASINIDFLRPYNAPTHGDDRIRIAGDKGILEIQNEKLTLINAENDGTKKIRLPQPKSIFKDFLTSVLTEKECMISAEDSFEMTRIALLTQRAADTGKSVNL